MNSPDEIEEERRLAYVAITRAKKKLYLTTAAQRMLFGQTTWNKPSRFAREIPKELLETIDTTVDQKKWDNLSHAQPLPAGTIRTGGMSAVSASPAASSSASTAMFFSASIFILAPLFKHPGRGLAGSAFFYALKILPDPASQCGCSPGI